jgi:hypothetical protein
VLANKNLGIAITAAAVMAGLMIGVAGPGRAQDKAGSKPAAPALNWKDNAEYEMATAAADPKATPAQHLAALDKWKMSYPSTEYIDARQNMYLLTYEAVKQPRQAFDMAMEILKAHPTNIDALYATVSQVTLIKPAPTPADMDVAEKNANLFLDNPDSVKPAAVSDADWAKSKAQIKPFSEQVLMAIYALRKDDKRAVDDLRKLIVRDPNLAVASYQLGKAMMDILAAEKRPQDQPPALYQIARAIAVTGPGALPANQVAAIQDYLKKAYKAFHGSEQGLDDLLAQAKTNPFPPPNFTIKSTVDIATEQEAARQAEIAKNPLMYTWVHGVKEKLASDGDAYFDQNVKDTALPPPDDKATPPAPQYFDATIISMTPATKPKEILVGIEKPDVADAKLMFDMPLPGKMEAGEKIQFLGTAKDWSHDPKNVVVTFEIVDPKTDLKGWTGKNAPAGRGAGKGAAPKAAPKQ